MENINGRIKNLVSGIEGSDAATIEQATAMNVAGVKKILTKRLTTSAVVTGGQVVFYLTDDGTAGGDAYFPTSVFKSSANFWVDDASTQYQMGGYTISGDRKTLTLTTNRLGSVLLGILQFIAAANGVTVHLKIEGN